MVTRVTYGDKDRDKGGDGYTDRDEGWYSGMEVVVVVETGILN